MRISVCMATYNGAGQIRPQLISILSQLDPCDQVVVVDDCSTDDTVQQIRSFEDFRIELFENPTNVGAAKTFERALQLATGDLIFLSDQDDLWLDNKVSVIGNIFSTQDVDLIVHNAIVVRGNQVMEDSLFRVRNSASGVIKNLISNTYTGCCMAFRKEILEVALPIPSSHGILHDVWIGILANLYGYKIVFLDTPLIEFRRHEKNATTLERRKIFSILSERIELLFFLVGRLIWKTFA